MQTAKIVTMKYESTKGEHWMSNDNSRILWCQQAGSEAKNAQQKAENLIAPAAGKVLVSRPVRYNSIPLTR